MPSSPNSASPAGTPASPAKISQASQARRQSTGAVCSLCKAITKSGQHTLRCLHCGDSIHLACQYKLYKDAGYEALKNKMDWLAEYIGFAALAYRCKVCVEKYGTCTQVSMATSETNSDVSQEIVAVTQSIASLDSKIQALHTAINQLGPANRVASTSADQSQQVCPPSYAAVVSADMVKNAVSAAIQEQQKASTDKSSIAVFGFPKEGNDYAQLLDMFDFLDARCDIIRQSRLGRLSQRSGDSNARPIKVELRSVNDAVIILARARCLREDAFYADVYIKKWLSEDEMKEVKLLRRQCTALNRDQPSDINGRRRFVVLSGKIMERNPSGRLEAYEGSRGGNPAVGHGVSSSTAVSQGTSSTTAVSRGVSSSATSTTVSHGTSSTTAVSRGVSSATAAGPTALSSTAINQGASSTAINQGAPSSIMQPKNGH